MAKVNQADLKREIEAQDRKDSRKKFFNVNALRLMLVAAKKVKDTKSFANAFTPTSGNKTIARKLKLGLDVVRGQWVLEDGKHNPRLNRMKESKMTQVNEAVDGKKLIELLMQALEEGDALKVSEYTNQMLSQKVLSCLQDQRVLISEQLFLEGNAAPKQTSKQVEAEFRDVVRQLNKLKGVKSSAKKKLENRLLSLDKKKALARLGLGEDLATDLAKVSNLNRNKDSDAPELEDEQLPNMELATDDLATDDTFDEARPAQPKFKVGNAVDVEVGFGKFEKGTVTKVGPRQLDGIWVKMTKTKKTTNFPIGLVTPRGQPRKIVDEGSESVGLDTFRQ